MTRSSWVPLTSIIGGTHVPPSAAIIIRAAVQQIAADNNISPTARWQCIEYMAAEYLAG